MITVVPLPGQICFPVAADRGTDLHWGPSVISGFMVNFLELLIYVHAFVNDPTRQPGSHDGILLGDVLRLAIFPFIQWPFLWEVNHANFLALVDVHGPPESSVHERQ
jgi:hypothetical protein